MLVVKPLENITVGQEYLEHLWWVMHHSYAPGRQTFALTAYFDDSGSDDLSPVTTIGGPVMSKDAFIDFGVAWEKLLDHYRIPQPLHMTDFVRPHGKHVGIYHELKLSLFGEIAELINGHKLYSVSVAVGQDDFNSGLSDEVRKHLIGPYGMAFFCSILANQSVSEGSLIYAAERIAYLLDSGFPFSEQLVGVHASIIRVRRASKKSCFVGSLAFDSDDHVPALQAADVVAWSARRKALGALTDEFAPLGTILLKRLHHIHVQLPKGGVNMFATPINNWIATGILPSLEDILR